MDEMGESCVVLSVCARVMYDESRCSVSLCREMKCRVDSRWLAVRDVRMMFCSVGYDGASVYSVDHHLGGPTCISACM